MRRCTRQPGFTLIETIAAVVILSLSIPPVLYAISEAHIQRVNPVLASKARWLAEEKLEEVIADRHSAARGYDYLQSSNYPAESPVDGFDQFTRRITLQERTPDLATPSPGSGFMVVAVELSWTDATGTLRTLSIETVLTEYDTP